MTEILSARYSALDVETTGLSPKKDEIIEIAIIPMLGSRILIGGYFFSLVKPKKFRAESIKFHGIGIDAINEAPSFERIAERVRRIVEGSIVVCYSEFDAEILKNHFSKVKMKFEFDWVDISQIERWLARREGRNEDLDMDGLIEKYGLCKIYRHTALADAYYTACIFQKQLIRLSEYGVSLAELSRIGKREKFIW